MLPWKLRKRHILPVIQNFSLVYFSLAIIWQMTYTHKLQKLCSATLTYKSIENYLDKIKKKGYRTRKNKTFNKRKNQ